MAKLTKLIYVASAYSCKNPDHDEQQKHEVRQYRYNLVTKLIGKLQDLYEYAFIGPITQSHHTAGYMAAGHGAGTEFAAWQLRDYTYISRSDEVWVFTMQGWLESIGVQAEIAFATKRGIKVRYINDNLQEIKFIRKPKK